MDEQIDFKISQISVAASVFLMTFRDTSILS